MSDFKIIIEEICNELDIKLDIISNGWVYVMEKDGIIRFATATTFDNNPHALGKIFDDKYATYELLRKLSIPVILHKIVYDQDNKSDFAKGLNNRDYVCNFFHTNNEDIVLKANNGYGGKKVFHLTKESDIDSCLLYLFSKSYSVSMCPFYKIKNEYRVFVLDNRVELIYKKVRPVVTGDGIRTIKELLIELNHHFFANKDLDNSYNQILSKDEKFEYNWQFNLSKGAVMSFDIDDNIKNDILSIINKIIDSIDIGFATIDIVELENGEKMVMEINSGVAMGHFRKIAPNGREISKKIYKKAIMKLFNL